MNECITVSRDLCPAHPQISIPDRTCHSFLLSASSFHLQVGRLKYSKPGVSQVVSVCEPKHCLHAGPRIPAVHYFMETPALVSEMGAPTPILHLIR